MTISRRLLIAPAASIVFVLALSACGSSTGNTGTGPAATPAGAAAEAGGGEAGTISWTDPQHRYKIDSPGAMTVAADGRASAIRPAERLEVSILTGSTGGTPMALAQADTASLKSSATNFHLLMAPTYVSINNRRSVKLLYEWTAGTNSVTGKPANLTTARYYIPKDSTRLAVVTYGIATSQYDPQGADDVATSFTWLS
ncbi:MAG: hypothetical protein M3003_07310 [Candidatus Dormibacteraeota bacterium]|nr:hypothetical protein [Candidatus Dormibacteraeota bacterium]